jgi:class 3 adenylate cyclase
VQNLAASRSILATDSVVEYPQTSKLLEASGLKPMPQQAALRGINEEVKIYEIP